jgi:2',3'-cyclic-nucleotide 2'-phosphodiesterase (5'-nucleotidase family)/LysM repeat protein
MAKKNNKIWLILSIIIVIILIILFSVLNMNSNKEEQIKSQNEDTNLQKLYEDDQKTNNEITDESTDDKLKLDEITDESTNDKLKIDEISDESTDDKLKIDEITDESTNIQQKIEYSDNGKKINMIIIATSDIHGRFMPYEYAIRSENKKGSLAQISTIVKEIRTKNPNTIVVDAGDTIQDNYADIFINETKNPIIEAMNYINYDAWILGNHEFNFGIEPLKKIIKEFKNEVISSNIYDESGNRLVKPYTILEIEDGIKIGIIGTTHPDIMKWDRENLNGYTVTDPAIETKKIINEIKENVDFILSVNHIGMKTDEKDITGIKNILNKNQEIDALIFGHDHKKIQSYYYSNGQIYEKPQNQIKEKMIPIIEPGKWGETLAKIEVTFTKENGKYEIKNREEDIKISLIDIQTKEKTIEPDPEIVKILKPYHEKALKDADTVIGTLMGGDLVEPNQIENIPQVWLEPSAMIDLINKVQIYYANKLTEQNVFISAAAAFREDANIKKGSITKADISKIYKFDNTLYVLQMTGKQLKEYMEWSVEFYNQYQNDDLTISFTQRPGYLYDMFTGIKYQIDISQPNGNRIKNLKYMNDEEIKEKDKINIAVNNYRANTQLLTPGIIFQEELPKVIAKSDYTTLLEDENIREMIIRYIKEEKNGIIFPTKDDNWNIIGNNWNLVKWHKMMKLIEDKKIEVDPYTSVKWENIKDLAKNIILKYKVIKGDWLLKISRMYGIEYMKIAEENNIKNPDLIYPNQIFTIPENYIE